MSPAAALVRRHDRDRFQTVLFAPAARREELFTLYAFNYEIARVREVVREEMLGRIRLQWWRDAVAAAYEGGAVRRHDVVEPITALIRRRTLDRVHFDRLIDSREEDLTLVPPPSLAALEDYCEGSSARLVVLAAQILGLADRVSQPAAREIGIGYGMAGQLRALPFQARRMIPDEIAAGAELKPHDYHVRPAPAALRKAVAAVAEAAARHLAAGRNGRRAIPRSALAAFLPAIAAGRYLARLRRAGYDPFDPALTVPDPLQSWRLLAAALRNRY